MTKYELMVIAAAAAAFVLINIIMWSIIIFRERKAREKNAQNQTEAIVRNTAPTVEIPAVNPQPTVRRPRVKRSDFIVIDDIVIVHTDERIE